MYFPELARVFLLTTLTKLLFPPAFSYNMGWVSLLRCGGVHNSFRNGMGFYPGWMWLFLLGFVVSVLVSVDTDSR
jgi:hypothetical protein